ncbi:anthranilate synthase / indole-3-glycerol phosphate synthase [Coemansia aciculifera]|nr:anthranilate synthase / indole-3-glycerol phosphate synthase [Coemansia aciculifera]
MSVDKGRTNVVVKTCGIQTVEAAMAAAAAGADIIGVIFAVSGRQIDTARAQEIARAIRGPNDNQQVLLASDLHHTIDPNASASEYFKACTEQVLQDRGSRRRPLLAGVFQNQDLDHILDMVRAVPLDLVQLHGTEPIEFAEKIPVPVIKVFHVDEKFSLDGNSDLFRTFRHAVILLDTKVAGTDQQGGKGVSFDWRLARRLAEMDVPFLMAGGLTPDNVAEAVRVGGAWGVDVSSGIETNKVKDVAKIRHFVDNAKTYYK